MKKTYLKPPGLSVGFTGEGRQVHRRLENILAAGRKKAALPLLALTLALLFTGTLVACGPVRAAEPEDKAADPQITANAPAAGDAESFDAAAPVEDIPTDVDSAPPTGAALEDFDAAVPVEDIPMEADSVPPSEDAPGDFDAAAPVEDAPGDTAAAPAVSAPEEAGNAGEEGGILSVVPPLNYAAGVTLTMGYGSCVHPVTGQEAFHDGVDLEAADGTPVFAATGGIVTEAAYDEVYGSRVTIDGGAYGSAYAHLSKMAVRAGDPVAPGDLIGYVGQTGWATGPHLHLTVYRDGAVIDPAALVPMP